MFDDVVSTIDDAEAMLRSRRHRAKSAELLRRALASTRDPQLLERIRALAVAGAETTLDHIARRVLWDDLVAIASRRLDAANGLVGLAHPALWESGDGLVTGKLRLDGDALVLASHHAGLETIPYTQIVRARLASRAEEALEGRATLVLEHERGTTFRIAIRSASVFAPLVAAFA